MASDAVPARKRKPNRIMFRVVEGGLKPADRWAAAELERKGYKVGQIVGASVSKLRNPRFNSLVHGIGQLCIDMLEEFRFYSDAHDVIKRLQLESGAGCDLHEIRVCGKWITVKDARSLGFDSMDEAEYHAVAKALCDYLSEEYWGGLDPEEIARMAERMVDR